MKFRQLLLILFICPVLTIASKYNAYGLKFYTVETEHFQIHYMDGCGGMIKRVAGKFEQLYSIYRNTYGLKLPNKTNVVILDSDESNGFAFSNMNTITLWTHDFDFDMRGSHDWFEDVIAHEYAHIVSIYTAIKTPQSIPEVRFGYFSHPNEKNRLDIMQSYPTDILPPWFTEGIAQYESSRHGADAWDSHRDMILRTLAVSGKLISWDHMQVFTGRGDDYEKTYDHGFSLVKYISETYGYDKVAALLRASAKITRLNFDRSIKEVLGISGIDLYNEWKKHLETQYNDQIKNIGTQVYGKKINKDGYENFYPKFSPDGKSIYFLSNGKSDYGKKVLFKYALSDTVKEKNKFKFAMNFGSSYDIHEPSGLVCYTSQKSLKSVLPPNKGGAPVRDLFIDKLPSDSHKSHRKTEHQITFQKDIFSASFSPKGNMIACAQRDFDKFKLVITDTSGKKMRTLYPQKASHNDITYIYSVDWAPDGNRIAFSYFDVHDRKIGIYDTLNKTFDVICDTDGDERDPVFSPDGKQLYFSSDRTGIFNIYRYDFENRQLDQITNVSGGAFAPAISPDDKKLVYAGYDKDGFGIYLLDQINPIKKVDLLQPQVVRKDFKEAPICTVSLSPAKKYSRLPRQFMFIPAIIGEQLVADQGNVNKGKTVLETGVIFDIFEPLTLNGLGSEISGYALIEASKLFKFIDPDHGFINPKATYEMGLFGNTNILPLPLSFNYSVRGIAGRDSFFDEINMKDTSLLYNSTQHNFDLQVSHYFGASGTGEIRDLNNMLGVHFLAGLNMTNVTISDDNFKYNLDKGGRIGLMGTMGVIAPNARSNISPEGMVAKIQYTLNDQYSLKDDNSLTFDNSILKEHYDTYLYHQVNAHVKWGIPAPWYPKHDFHIDFNGIAVEKAKEQNDLPSFYLPAAWVPGYSYYFRSKKIKRTNSDSSATTVYDTLVVTGKAVMNGEISYRFPLWPGMIDKKLGFLYLDRLYGAVNACGGAGWMKPMDFFNFDRKDWLVSYGGEIRLEAKAFGSNPVAIKFRWDKGIDSRTAFDEKGNPQKESVGGNRFTFSLGYDFDNWATVLEPDYHSTKGPSY